MSRVIWLALDVLNALFFAITFFICYRLYRRGLAQFQRERERLVRVIADHLDALGLELIEAKVEPFGPWIMKSALQRVFRINVARKDGTTATGWVRLGGFFTGLRDGQIECRWDPAGERRG